MKIVINGQAVEVPSGEGGGGGEVYSTEETRIGTWIDGKPLYRKVVERESNGDTPSFAIFPGWFTETDIDTLVSVRTMVFVPVPNTNSAQVFYNCAVRDDADDSGNHTLQMINSVSRSGLSPSKLRFIFEYTKTTD